MNSRREPGFLIPGQRRLEHVWSIAARNLTVAPPSSTFVSLETTSDTDDAQGQALLGSVFYTLTGAYYGDRSQTPPRHLPVPSVAY